LALLEQRRAVAAAHHQLGAFILREGEIAADLVELLVERERPHLRRRIHRIAKAEPAGRLDHPLDELIMDGALGRYGLAAAPGN
jgi:hypothetical protein